MTSKQKRHNTPTKPALSRRRRSVIIGMLVVCVIGCVIAAYGYLTRRYDGTEPVRFYIPAGATVDAIADTLGKHLGGEFGGRVYNLWSLQQSDPGRATGSYVVRPGDRAISVSRNVRYGRQTPITLTFNNIRTLDQLAERVSARFTFTPREFIAACDSLLPAAGFAGRRQYAAAFLPDSYSFYWTATPLQVVERLLEERNKYWTDARRAQAKSLGLTPVEVATVASIVEEETNKADERPLVARLYLNRLKSGMKLQADPTIKFAIGDFSIRRISGPMLRVLSPYNTYRIQGLPPGPIRVAEQATMEGVLNAPTHNYLYMCAREDFSGYHNFAVDYATHRANAARYQAELNRRGIRAETKVNIPTEP